MRSSPLVLAVLLFCSTNSTLAEAQPLSQPPDLFAEPWNQVRLSLEHQDSIGAENTLARIAQSNTLDRTTKAYAWRWAGQLALRERRLTQAQQYLLQAYQLQPTSSEAQATLPRLAEIALLRQDDESAHRWLTECSNAQDPVVRAYAAARQQAVHERLRRRRFRPVFFAVVALSITTITALLLHSLRAQRTRNMPSRFAKGIVLTEAIAIAVVAIAPRMVSSMALSSVALVSVISALFAAILIAIWPSLAPSRRAIAVLALLCAMGAGSYLALDYLYWTPTRPIAP